MEKLMVRARDRRAQLLATPSPDAYSPSLPTAIQQQPISMQMDTQGFVPGMDGRVGLHHAVAAMSTPESVDGTWPNVWDAVDFSYAAPGTAQMAWTSYENFVADFYVNVDDPLVNR